MAKEVYGINQKSLENLASNFRARYENNTIFISKIQALNSNELRTLNKKGKTSLYKR